MALRAELGEKDEASWLLFPAATTTGIPAALKDISLCMRGGET